MTVLERNTQGLEGWWLCSLHGRQGIVPGNRLKILVGMYDKKQGMDQSQQKPQQQQAQQQPPQTPLPYNNQSVYNVLSTNQYPPMHSSFQSQSADGVYLVPTAPKGQQTHYQTPQGSPHPGQTTPSKQSTIFQNQLPQHQFTNQDIYQVPPSMNQPQELYQVKVGSTSPPQSQDIYQIPPSAGTGLDIYQVPPSMTTSQEIYQVPPSMDMRGGGELRKPPGKVVLPTRKGQVYVYDSPKPEPQDEYDIPRHLLPAGPQEIYDVPTRCLVNNYSPEVYDIPPMAVKGPVSREQTQEIYDIPPSVEKNLPEYLQSHLMIYDIPPSVNKDVPDGPQREDTYDFPPAFSNQKMQLPPKALTHIHDPEPYIPEDIYDIPPAAKGNDSTFSQEIYDVPPSLRKPAGQNFNDVYDVPREFHGGKASLETEADYIYDVPPQVDREVKVVDELTGNFKRLSASSTGSTRSNISTSSLDVIPVKESSVVPPKTPVKELNLDLEAAMELLVKLQHGVNSSISYLMSFISSTWRSQEHMEVNIQSIQAAAEGVKNTVKELLEFARGAVVNSAQASDRTLHAKLSKQLQKMEDVYQQLLKHSQALDSCNWALNVLVTNKPGSSDDLDRFVMYSRGIPDDTKQLASFLHGNASLLFKRTKQQHSVGDSQPGQENSNHLANNNNNLSAGPTEKTNIQSRPLPSPPKFVAEDSPEGQYENNESGWMEDYDYVHLQGKEEFEKTQKELLEKGNIIRQGKGHLEQQQLKQFERLEEEVARPIENDLSNWTPPQHYSQVRSALSNSDRQLLLFYQEQCEANVTTLTNAIDAFYSSISSNQPPKIFVAHSKFVILSAHKLVFIGDTLSRQAKAQDIRNKVTHYSNLMCDKLKEIVLSTKTAALQYPSPSAAKDMVERVKDLSNSTQQFRMVLGQLAAI
ncbi:breast cancer anti-estrogen resistance protein 1 isoform X2 [Dendrobates tinctorius]